MACACINLVLYDFPTTLDGGSPTCFFSGNLTQSGLHNGVPYYEFYATPNAIGGAPVFLVLYRDNSNRWGIGNQILSGHDMMWNKYYIGDCPPYCVFQIGVDPWEWQGVNYVLLSPNLVCTTSGCGTSCCLTITYTYEGVVYTSQSTTNNGNNTWTFFVDGIEHNILFDARSGEWWIVNEQTGETINILNHVPPNVCPASMMWLEFGMYLTNVVTTEVACSTSCDNEDRISRTYMPISLPESNESPCSPIDSCCCEQLVLGHSEGGYKSDITPIWIKLDASGSANFVLLKNGVSTSYAINVLPIIKEANGMCAMIDWYDVLMSDGVGSYQLSINYNISGISSSVVWGNYKLMPYTISNAYYTARVKAYFNSYHEKQNIDFTDTNLMGTLRFNGFIGNRQPNTKVDNIIYGNREMKSVIRENLNSYEIRTDPQEECIISVLIDVYLLHENQLFISDYNYHNHLAYKDVAVILEESAEVTYYDISKKASVVAKVGDKFKNDNNFYK